MNQAEHRSQDRILFQLKTLGSQTAGDVGSRLGMTPAGARQHLLKLETAGLVESEDQREGRGRPRKYWRVGAAGARPLPPPPSRPDPPTFALHACRLLGAAGGTADRTRR